MRTYGRQMKKMVMGSLEPSMKDDARGQLLATLALKTRPLLRLMIYSYTYY